MTGPLPVDAHRHDVQELLDVVVGNVLRHTPPGRDARVTTIPRPDGGGCLVVEDAGPGLDANANDPPRGTGLGLAIARRVALEAGGLLALGRSDLGEARGSTWISARLTSLGDWEADALKLSALLARLKLAWYET
jgi:signal transduction histidine kinase